MMKIVLLGATLIAMPSFALANEGTHVDPDSSKKDVVKTYDSKQYCYYADLEYSKGAVMEQDSTMKVCAVGPEGNLIWIDQ
ncbi:DUF1496 domain-containing protein [Pseudoalteromonas sp. McH1-7]|nr:DUF1496 domain-containing protein [Pseudoalteromonas sp. McH1-7]USD27798.1 DUF1496 domain-containing protein [Pseudoalteromonas sp. SCSIO 43201]